MNQRVLQKTIWISGALFVLSQGTLLYILSSVDSGWNILHHQTTFSPETFEAYFEKWGPEKSARFLSHYYLDFLHPLIYLAFLASCLGITGAFVKRRVVFVLPILAAVFDEIENTIQIQIAFGSLDSISPIFFLGATAARLKWLLVAATVVAIMTGWWGMSHKGQSPSNPL